MIMLYQTELATYRNKLLDLMDLKALPNSVRFVPHFRFGSILSALNTGVPRTLYIMNKIN
jgi:hypothetical protein